MDYEMDDREPVIAEDVERMLFERELLRVHPECSQALEHDAAGYVYAHVLMAWKVWQAARQAPQDAGHWPRSYDMAVQRCVVLSKHMTEPQRIAADAEWGVKRAELRAAAPTMFNGLTEAETAATASVAGLSYLREQVAKEMAPVYEAFATPTQEAQPAAPAAVAPGVTLPRNLGGATGGPLYIAAPTAPAAQPAQADDAARYQWLLDWLKRNGLLYATRCQPGAGEAVGDYWVLRGVYVVSGTSIQGYGKTEDAAIDAARQSQQPGSTT